MAIVIFLMFVMSFVFFAMLRRTLLDVFETLSGSQEKVFSAYFSVFSWQRYTFFKYLR